MKAPKGQAEFLKALKKYGVIRMSPQPCQLAQNITAEATGKVGFDPTIILTIIGALLPALQSIFSACKPAPKPATPAEMRQFVSDRYTNGQYAHGVLNPAIRESRQAARQNGHRINRADAETLATISLDHIRESDDETLQEAMSQ